MSGCVGSGISGPSSSPKHRTECSIQWRHCASRRYGLHVEMSDDARTDGSNKTKAEEEARTARGASSRNAMAILAKTSRTARKLAEPKLPKGPSVRLSASVYLVKLARQPHRTRANAPNPLDRLCHLRLRPSRFLYQRSVPTRPLQQNPTDGHTAASCVRRWSLVCVNSNGLQLTPS